MARSSVARSSVLVLAWCTACRISFDLLPEAPDGGPDAPPVLACGAPARFSLDPAIASGSLLGFAAAAGATSYYAFAVDGASAVHGFSAEFSGDQLAAIAMDAPVYAGATGAIAAIGTADGVLAAIVYGTASPTGSLLLPLDRALASRGAAHDYPGWLGGERALAEAPGGTLAIVGQTTDVMVKLVSADGSELGMPALPVAPAEGASLPTIAASGTGFLLTWDATAPSPNEVHAAVLDPQLAVTQGSTSIYPTRANLGTMYDARTPSAAYAALADRYLFAWSLKLPNSVDQVWITLRDNQLGEVTSFPVASHGVLPKIAAGPDSFLVVWSDRMSASGLAGVRVKASGAVDPLTIAGSGGTVAGWDLVTRAGQAALVWIEIGGATPILWIDPLCA